MIAFALFKNIKHHLELAQLNGNFYWPRLVHLSIISALICRRRRNTPISPTSPLLRGRPTFVAVTTVTEERYDAARSFRARTALDWG